MPPAHQDGLGTAGLLHVGEEGFDIFGYLRGLLAVDRVRGTLVKVDGSLWQGRDGSLVRRGRIEHHRVPGDDGHHRRGLGEDRKSTRLNSSHVAVSYAGFRLKKKKNQLRQLTNAL